MAPEKQIKEMINPKGTESQRCIWTKYFLHKIFDTIHKKSLHKHILPADSHYIITILSSEVAVYRRH